MAVESKGRTRAKPSSGSSAASTTPPVQPAPTDPPPVAKAPVAKAMVPSALLVEQQIRTLADLCEALDRKCMELLTELSTCHDAEMASRGAASDAMLEFANYRNESERRFAALSELRERELTEAARTRATLERDLAAVREALDRSNRAAAAAVGDTQDWRRPEGHARAARLLPMLNTVLAEGELSTLHDTLDALGQYGAAGMVDSVGGTLDSPFCNGWLLSRSDMDAEPLIFLVDDDGMLGWTEGNRERLDVNMAFENTKPRPGFKAALSRVPIGRVRAIIAIAENDTATAVFFEAASRGVPPDLFSGTD
jgi:hypothetical protein